jgi:hypothetical protein
VIGSTVEAALRELVAARSALDSLEAMLVVRARSSGATWSDLAVCLGLSKQGARKRYLAIDPIFKRRSLRAQTIEEYHAEFVAAMRAQGVFLE